ncbi:MAG: outer membrane beta-barrel protein [Flavobacteriaceae bacterium]|nr:outer membrane beta-barrel protein [Flavobacteriaceae bacterium]
MRKLVVLSLLLSSLFVQAQKLNRIEIGVFHPLAVGDNFLEQSYNGFIGVDAKFTYAKPSVFRFKVGADASWIKEDGSIAAANDVYRVNPKLEFGVNVPVVNLQPYINIGYVFYIIADNDPLLAIFEDDALSGLNIGLGVNYSIGKWFYIDANYQLSKLNQDTINSNFFETIEFINVGVGIRI